MLIEHVKNSKLMELASEKEWCTAVREGCNL